MKLFEDAGILERHDFRDGRSRYEEMPESHHDHLIDVQTGSVIEFRNEDIEKLQRRVAEELGFELVDHRLELYGVPKGAQKLSARALLAPLPACAPARDHAVLPGCYFAVTVMVLIPWQMLLALALRSCRAPQDLSPPLSPLRVPAVRHSHHACIGTPVRRRAC